MRLLLLTTGLWPMQGLEAPMQGLETFNGSWSINDGSILVYTVREVYYRCEK